MDSSRTHPLAYLLLGIVAAFALLKCSQGPRVALLEEQQNAMLDAQDDARQQAQQQHEAALLATLERFRIADPGLKDCIKDRLNFGMSGRSVPPELQGGHLENLTELRCEYRKIESLAGIQNVTGLKTLVLTRNNIVDVSPLRSLTNLKSLWLGDNPVRDLYPLWDLHNIQTLRLPNLEKMYCSDVYKVLYHACIKEVTFSGHDSHACQGSRGEFMQAKSAGYHCRNP